jgi:hypothetical protein
VVTKLERKFERGAAADLWRHTLAQIPTVFGRLVYLATLRSPNTGSYEHHGLAQHFGDEEADRTLRQSHFLVFSEWLCFNLEQQKSDLDEYLAGLEGGTRTVLSTWIRLAPYRNLLPTNCREVEKQLYNADLETILELLRYEYDVACPDPEA